MKSATPCSDTTSQKKNNNKCRGNNLVVRNITPRSLSSSVVSPPNQVTHSGYAELLKTKKKDSESFFFHQWGYAIYTHTARSRHFIPGRDARKSPKVSLSLFFLFVIFNLSQCFLRRFHSLISCQVLKDSVNSQLTKVFLVVKENENNWTSLH